MRFLTNEDVSALLDHRTVVEALRIGYAEYRDGHAAQIPRADLIAPARSGVHRLGVMAGVSRAFDVAVVRIKSDIVRWVASREEKHSTEEGLYSGTVVAFRVSDGAPIAVIHDGVLQHLRVAGAAGLGTQMLAPGEVESLGVLGSGGMARALLTSMGVLGLVPGEVRVFSPKPEHRRAFVDVLEAEFPHASLMESADPEAAVRGASIVVTATSSTEPTVAPEWLERDAHVTAVSRREIGADLRASADLLACLGPSSYPAGVVPGMTPTRGGYGAFVAMTPEELSEMPEPRSSDEPDEYPLMVRGAPWAERPQHARTVLAAVGTQGVQFAATVGALLRKADEHGMGTDVARDLFLHRVRN